MHLLALLAAAAVPLIPVRFANPARIRYDGQCFTINGKDTFVYSGAFHYFRCPKPLWAERFKAIKEAGFNTVETYCAWNYHEPQMPKSLGDFSKMDTRDLSDWLDMATNKFGFNVIVRPGPYICAEWDEGGYPHWLTRKKPANAQTPWLRGEDPIYLAWCEHWYKAACKAIAPYQITRRNGKPGVILFQIENEYDYCGGGDTVHIGQLKALAKDAWDNGIDVPLITCWTHQVRGSSDPVLSQVMDCTNHYPRWDVESVRGSLESGHESQPNKPIMVTELQGGWFSEIGGLLAEDQPGITAAQEQNLTLYCIQNGLTALNYYMLFGGTNFGDRTPPNITTSYDYDAPLREPGGKGDKYRVVQGLGEMIREHGEQLARSVDVPIESEGAGDDVQVAMRKSPDGARFIFVRTNSRTNGAQGHIRIPSQNLQFDYDLQPFGSKVLFLPASGGAGEWLPRVASAPERPAAPAAMSIRTASVREEKSEAGWSPIELGRDLANQGIYDSRYVMYRSSFMRPADAPSSGVMTLIVRPLSPAGIAVLGNNRILRSTGKAGSAILFDFPLTEGRNSVEILYENTGHPNGGPMDEGKGLADVSLVQPMAGEKSLATWRVKQIDAGDPASYVPSATEDNSSPEYHIRGGYPVPFMRRENAVGVYQTTFDMTADDIAGGLARLEFDGIDDHGWVYLNGKKIGEAHDWGSQHVFDVSGALRVGRNILSVVVKNDGGEGGLTAPARLTKSLPKGQSMRWELCKNLAGLTPSFWNSGEWRTQALSAETPPLKHDPKDPESLPRDPSPEHGALVRWYGLSFSTPKSPGVKTPWRLVLNATGNGMIYLNGHALGRFWEIGPQRAYYLPECWLKPVNEVRIGLRQTEHGCYLESAQVAPYAEFAERE